MKNKLFSTKKNLISSHNGFYLGGLAILLLSGCDASNVIESLTGTRADQQVVGGRRIPNLNPRRSIPSKIEQPKTEPSFTTTQPQAANNPYDMYDAGGNEVTKPSKESVIIESNINSSVNTKFTDSNFSAPKQPALTNPAPKNLDMPASRKPLAGNPYSPEASAPASVVKIQAEEIKITETIKESKNISLNMEAPKLESKKEDNEDLFGQIGSYFTFDTETTSKKDDTQSTYPKISSVPPKPEEFETIKIENQQNFNDLKLEHNVATQEKISLEREVSGELPEKSPEESIIPLVQSISPIVVEEKKSSENKMGLKQPSFEQKILTLPAPISDEEISKKDEPVIAVEVKKPVLEQSNFYQNNGLPPLSEPEPKEKSSYFSDILTPLWGGDDSQSDSKDTVIVSPTYAPAEDKIKAYSAPLISAKKEDGSESNSQSSFEPASKVLGDTSSLPSPEMIKTLPPSRYEGLRTKSSSAQ